MRNNTDRFSMFLLRNNISDDPEGLTEASKYAHTHVHVHTYREGERERGEYEVEIFICSPRFNLHMEEYGIKHRRKKRARTPMALNLWHLPHGGRESLHRISNKVDHYKAPKRSLRRSGPIISTTLNCTSVGSILSRSPEPSPRATPRNVSSWAD